ncbi:MAG: hypothetical protein JNK34_05765 [Tabrizicola sp.]|nr:hypothetical protein [Tabrizicola sp.]
MIRFAFVDDSGFPTGGGARRELPAGAVPLPEPWTTTDLPRLRFKDGTWQERTDISEPAPPTVEEVARTAAAHLQAARQQALERVNARVGTIRKLIYTDIPGQDALYLEKRAEAIAYVAEARGPGEPVTLKDYPLLANEVGITAATPWQLAQIWLFRSSQFKDFGAATEKARMTAAIAITSARDFEEIEAAERRLVDTLQSLPL